MQFDSISAFFDMGGYGFFVWLSYGSALLLFVLLIGASILGHKQTKKNIIAKLKRDRKLQQRAQQTSTGASQ